MTNPWSRPIEKEIARKRAKWIKIICALYTASTCGGILYAYFKIYPNLHKIYIRLGHPEPAYIKVISHNGFTAIFIVIAVTFFVIYLNHLNRKLEQNSMNWKSGQEVRVCDVFDTTHHIYMTVIIILPAFVSSFLVQLPIKQVFTMVS